jgi:hypothetical protein
MTAGFGYLKNNFDFAAALPKAVNDAVPESPAAASYPTDAS